MCDLTASCRLDPLFDFVRSANKRVLRSIRPNNSSAVFTQLIVFELATVMHLMTIFKLWRGDRLMLIRITSCLATSQTPESTRSSPAVKGGCSVSSNSWSVNSNPIPRQPCPMGLAVRTDQWIHHAHRCRRPAGGCSGITP